MMMIGSINLAFFNFLETLFMLGFGVIIFLIIFVSNGRITYTYAFFVIVCSAILMLSSHAKHCNIMLQHNTLQSNDRIKVNQERFVSRLLPPHAFEKQFNANFTDKLDLTDEFEEVTILFADIAGMLFIIRFHFLFKQRAAWRCGPHAKEPVHQVW